MIEPRDVAHKPETEKADGGCSCGCGLPCSCGTGDAAATAAAAAKSSTRNFPVNQIEHGGG